MFKGHATIELTDVKTGKKKVVEHDNMFTKAIYDNLNNGWVQMVGGLSTLKSWNLPLISETLGGIALFADNITEDENTTFFPEGNDVLGYAGEIASDGTSKFWGSRNFLETESYDPETKTIKWVWDFGTSQANGTIKALGLMGGKQADYYGDSLNHKQYSRRLEVSGYFSDFGYRIVEWDGDDVTWMVNGVGKVTINKSRFNFNKITLNNNLGTHQLVSSREVALPLETVNYTSMYWKDGYDDYWYGFMIMSNNQFNAPHHTGYSLDYGTAFMQVVRINKYTFAVESHNITFPSGYYACLPVINPIITKNYICCATSTSTQFRDVSSYYNSYYTQYVRKDKYVRISLSDWTVSLQAFEDDAGNKYFLFPNTYVADGNLSERFGTMFESLRLPNGTYQMNDLILDDDFKVIRQVKPPINAQTGAPAKDHSEYGNSYTIFTPWNTSLRPSDGDFYQRPMGWVLNKKKNLMLMFGRTSNRYYALIMPLVGQQLYTINNLSEPVTKTSTQSMKITYTVSDVEEA